MAIDALDLQGSYPQNTKETKLPSVGFLFALLGDIGEAIMVAPTRIETGSEHLASRIIAEPGAMTIERKDLDSVHYLYEELGQRILQIEQYAKIIDTPNLSNAAQLPRAL